MKNIAEYIAWRAKKDGQALTEVFSLYNTAYQNGNTVINAISTDDELVRKYCFCTENRLWLRRVYRDEQQLLTLLQQRLQIPTTAFSPSDNDLYTLNNQQKQALIKALKQNFLIINGGPGTGKTYTLARIAQSLKRQHPLINIALAAPTGKAAQRMIESLEAANVDTSFFKAQTLHRLLGGNIDTPLHNALNPLPFDLVIIDETSMLSLDLALKLFSALAPETRLILLGDAQQLAAVDAGAVLRDLLHLAPQNVVTLTESKRFTNESKVGSAALFLQNEASADELFNLLQPKKLTLTIYDELFTGFNTYLAALKNHHDMTQFFDEYRILTTTQLGNFGVHTLNEEMIKRHKKAFNLPAADFFHGLPLMLTVNNYRLNLFNGDIGFCIENNGALFLKFPQKDFIPFNEFNPVELTPAYALTIHKSQGSEFNQISLLLPDNEKLLSRELLYTGITRARTHLEVYCSKNALFTAVNTPTLRQTGFIKID